MPEIVVQLPGKFGATVSENPSGFGRAPKDSGLSGRYLGKIRHLWTAFLEDHDSE
jgi:hypothetical protein